MVNEVEEAIRIFTYYEKGERPLNVHPLHHDLLWLLDAVGHAGTVHSNLDIVEKDLKNKSHSFQRCKQAINNTISHLKYRHVRPPIGTAIRSVFLFYITTKVRFDELIKTFQFKIG